MKRVIICLSLILCAWVARAQMTIGVQLYDMFKTEMVFLMTPEEFRELKAEIAEEKAIFNRVVSKVKKDWDKQYAAARKAGDKLFPRYPTKPFIWVRSVKSKNFSTRKAAEEWYAKQKARVDAAMAARAAAIKEATKASKGAITAGYQSRDDKKAREKADKLALQEAVKEKLGEQIMLEMSALLKYNRPIPIHFIVDPVAGAEKTLGKQIAAQEQALEEYRARKAEAEAAGVTE